MTQASQYNITLIGCGKMGASMIHGWLKADLLKTLQILDPSDIDDSLTSHNDLFHVKLMESLDLSKTEIVILAVKPQIMDSICAELSEILPPNALLLSIAAGKSIAYFQKQLPEQTPVIRTMPNIPASIGKGITALYATDSVSDKQKEMASALMNAIGQTIWLDDEAQMDAVTALSGSGPAYLFHLIEAMASAGQKIGLSQEHAVQLARQTIIGASALAESQNDLSATTLRENVTSPAGTTEAALNILMDGRFQNIMDEAIASANRRGKELNDL